MASRERKGGGDFILESRHLVGLFFLLVVIFAVVFTLGYLLGRRQYDSGLRADNTKADSDLAATSESSKGKHKPEDVETLPSEKNSDWDFYRSAEPKTTEDRLQPPPKAVVSAKPTPASKAIVKSAPPSASNSAPKIAALPAKSTTTAKSSGTAKAPAPLNGPLIPKGNIMLQVAALQRQEDALALAQALQQKKFPAFVITPGTDKFYRVQVGPYVDAKSAAIARQDLEAKGFKSIIKR